MARRTSPLLVDHTSLVQPGHTADAIEVGSAAWYAWLTEATSFAFIGEHGHFTAHKERRGATREYWKAYRHHGGRLYRVYLGRSTELTFERLNSIAAELAGRRAGALLPRDPGLQGTSTTSADVPPGTQQSSAIPADDSQAQHLLATKLAIPMSHPGLVARPRLVQRLDSAILNGQKLILVSAPAGFGKTTLLVEWLASRLSDVSSVAHIQHVNAAWLSLDDSDNDLGQFLAYLIVALARLRPSIDGEAWSLLRTRVAEPPVQAILTMLLNALTDITEPCVLVLDDYHTISLQATHEAVAFLLDHMPRHMHIVLSTRADPPLPLARLRARVALGELRAADLRFTHDETAELFDRVHHIELPFDALTSLETRTEGWAAGLQLAGLSLQHQDTTQLAGFLADFTGSHAYVFDYLADEVFRRQPDAVQTFLMQTAILPRLCGPLCAAVTGQHDTQAQLEQLDGSNLFVVSLDSQRRWYRYHQLFRDFLSNCLHRAVGPAGIAQLHRRASIWFEQNGLAGEAVDHALSAQAWEDAIRCMAPLMADQRFYEYFLDWLRWVAAIPDHVLQADLDLCGRLARILILIGQIEAADRPLRLAEAVCQAAADQPKLGEILAYRALALALNRNFSQASEFAWQALARIPAHAIEQRGVASYVLGYSALALGQVGFAATVLAPAYVALQGTSDMLEGLAMAGGVARAAQLQGQLQRAAVLYQDVIRRAGGATQYEQPAIHFYLGRLYYEWNDLASAEHALQQGIEIGQRTGRGRFWPSAYAALAWVRWARGDAGQSASLMEQALASAQALNSPASIAEVQARQAGLWLAQGDLTAAARWLAGQALDIDTPVSYEQQIEYILLARIRIAHAWQAPGSANLDGVVTLLDRLFQSAQADERTADQIMILALLALGHAANDDPGQASASLAAALALAEPEGYIRTFVDEGLAMRSLLRLQRAQIPDGELGIRLRRYVDRLLTAFAPPVDDVPRPASSLAVLSERERAILALLADGRSVREIADHLIISVHTARSHVKHIYAKLDVHNRVQALERARGLQLL